MHYNRGAGARKITGFVAKLFDNPEFSFKSSIRNFLSSFQ